MQDLKSLISKHKFLMRQLIQKREDKMVLDCWLKRLIFKSRRLALVYAVVLIVTCISIFLADQASASETVSSQDSNQDSMIANNADGSSNNNGPANHRMEDEENLASGKTTSAFKAKGRQSRQYDTSIGASGSGSYASISGDGAAYVAQMPLSGTSYVSSSSNPNVAAANYANDLAGAYQSAAYHDPISMARAGYPSAPMAGSALHHSAGYPSSFGGPLSAMFAGSGSMFPLMGKGFDLSEIICTAIAVAIGAVIVGAPFILIYLFVMNQMNGNGPSLGQGGGAISLTGPTSSTTVSGRKKRHTSLPEALFKHLSPLVNSEQVSDTFKALMSSIAKYQM